MLKMKTRTMWGGGEERVRQVTSTWRWEGRREWETHAIIVAEMAKH